MMIEVGLEKGFEDWRRAARGLAARSVDPANIVWTEGSQHSLFASALIKTSEPVLNVPREFVQLAERVACFDSAGKWDLLYRLVFRLTHENRQLLQIESDADVLAANRMAKAVNRDVHKFHAFVRFRQIVCENEEFYIAWHEPHHFTVERATPFFARRFGAMKFSIFTPRGCAHWDLKKLSFSKPAERTSVPDSDEIEDFWLLYYRSIFNPFRIKISAMKNEFPRRHWPTLPEAALIPELIRSASG